MTNDASGPPDRSHDSEGSEELLLVVEVAARRCALRARDVVEVHRLVRVSPLPHAPTIIEGLIDAHGELLPVVDLGRRFSGLPLRPDLSHTLVIVDTASRRLALHVEQTVDLVSVDTGSLRQGEVAEAPYADGVAVLPDDLVVIYDLEAFLSIHEAAELDEALLLEKQRVP